MPKPKKGDVLVYTGGYAPEVTAPYGRGEVICFRTNRGVRCVTVRLIDEVDDEVYADWPVSETTPA